MLTVRRPSLAAALTTALACGLALGLTACSTAVTTPGASGQHVSRSEALTSPAQHCTWVVGSTTTGANVLTSAAVEGYDFALSQHDDGIRSTVATAGNNPKISGDPDISSEPFNEQRSVCPGDITVENPSNFPESGVDGIASVAGQVGSDVTGIDIRTHDGDVVHAAVANGLWIAAWDGKDFSDRGFLDPTFTVHRADGSTTTWSHVELTEG